LPETFSVPFKARRERRDEEGENDAHSIEIKIAIRNEIHADQARTGLIMRTTFSAYVRKHLNSL